MNINKNKILSGSLAIALAITGSSFLVSSSQGTENVNALTANQELRTNSHFNEVWGYEHFDKNYRIIMTDDADDGSFTGWDRDIAHIGYNEEEDGTSAVHFAMKVRDKGRKILYPRYSGNYTYSPYFSFRDAKGRLMYTQAIDYTEESKAVSNSAVVRSATSLGSDNSLVYSTSPMNNYLWANTSSAASYDIDWLNTEIKFTYWYIADGKPKQASTTFTDIRVDDGKYDEEVPVIENFTATAVSEGIKLDWKIIDEESTVKKVEIFYIDEKGDESIKHTTTKLEGSYTDPDGQKGLPYKLVVTFEGETMSGEVIESALVLGDVKTPALVDFYFDPKFGMVYVKVENVNIEKNSQQLSYGKGYITNINTGESIESTVSKEDGDIYMFTFTGVGNKPGEYFFSFVDNSTGKYYTTIQSAPDPVIKIHLFGKNETITIPEK